MDSILKNLKTGDFLLTPHAQERMRDRGITFQDIIQAGCTAIEPVKTLDDGKFEVDGFDMNERRLIVICVRRHKLLIITLFNKSRRHK